MAENLANDYTTTLDGAIDDNDTTLTVNSGGAPAPNFRIRIDDELMLVTGVASLVWTVTRGIEGTSAAAHADDAVVAHVLTAAGLTQFIEENVPEPGPAVRERYAEPPASPNAADDEFDVDGAVDTSKWTRVKSGTTKGTYTQKYGRLHYAHDLATAGTELDVWAQAGTISVGDYIEACFRYENTTAWCGFWLGFSNGTTFGTSDAVGTFMHWSGSTYRWMLNYYGDHNSRSNDGSFTDRWIMGRPVYVRVKYEAANTWGIYRSQNGIKWETLQTNYALTLTPTHMEVGVCFLGGGVGGEVEIFYFRKNPA